MGFRTPQNVRAGSRADLLSQAAEFIALAGEFDRATALARATLSEPEIAVNGERRAEVWRRIAWYRLMASDGPGVFGAYESAAAALESAPDTHSRARLAAEDAMARAIWGRGEDALAQADRALALAEAEGDLGARGLALNARGCVRSAAGDSDDAGRDLEQALDLARSHGTRQDVSRATLNLAATLVCAGRYEEGLALCEVGIDEATSAGLALPYAMICRNTAADALFALGRWPEAVSQVDAVLVLIDVGESARMAKGIRARIAVARGDPDLARHLLSEIPRQGRERDEPQLVAPACLALAELCAWSDLFEEGRAAVGAASTWWLERTLGSRPNCVPSECGLKRTVVSLRVGGEPAARRPQPDNARAKLRQRPRLSAFRKALRVPGLIKPTRNSLGLRAETQIYRSWRDGRRSATVGARSGTGMTRHTRTCGGRRRSSRPVRGEKLRRRCAVRLRWPTTLARRPWPRWWRRPSSWRPRFIANCGRGWADSAGARDPQLGRERCV